MADWYNVPQYGGSTVSVCTPTLIASHSNFEFASFFSHKLGHYKQIPRSYTDGSSYSSAYIYTIVI